MLNAPFMYAQDAYHYLREARDFASSGTIQLKTGMPFVLFLGAFLKISGPLLGEFLASSVFMLITSSLLVVSVYLLGVRMSGRLLGFLAGLIATFEPYCLEYSIVPYTDSFAILMGLLALYFATSDKKLQSILSPIFLYLAIFTRNELYLVLLIPILLFLSYKKLKIGSKQGVTASLIISFVLTIVVYLLPFIGLHQFLQSWGVIGIVERFALFLKPELLKITVESSFSFYDQQFLNQTIYVFVGLSIALALLNIFVEVKSEKTRKTFPISIQFKRAEVIRDTFFSDKVMTAFCLFLSFVIYIVVLMIFGFRYEWAFYVAPSDMANLAILSKALIIIPRLHLRYLIFPRLMISYPLAYILSLVGQKVYAETISKK